MTKSALFRAFQTKFFSKLGVCMYVCYGVPSVHECADFLVEANRWLITIPSSTHLQVRVPCRLLLPPSFPFTTEDQPRTYTEPSWISNLTN